MQHSSDLIYIPITFHDEIPNSYQVMGHTRTFFRKILSKGHYLKTKKGKQSFLCATNCLYLLHIPIKLHEDIMNSELVIECIRMKITQNKHKNTTKWP